MGPAGGNKPSSYHWGAGPCYILSDGLRLSSLLPALPPSPLLNLPLNKETPSLDTSTGEKLVNGCTSITVMSSEES